MLEREEFAVERNKVKSVFGRNNNKILDLETRCKTVVSEIPGKADVLNATVKINKCGSAHREGYK